MASTLRGTASKLTGQLNLLGATVSDPFCIVRNTHTHTYLKYVWTAPPEVPSLALQRLVVSLAFTQEVAAAAVSSSSSSSRCLAVVGGLKVPLAANFMPCLQWRKLVSRTMSGKAGSHPEAADPTRSGPDSTSAPPWTRIPQRKGSAQPSASCSEKTKEALI